MNGLFVRLKFVKQEWTQELDCGEGDQGEEGGGGGDVGEEDDAQAGDDGVGEDAGLEQVVSRHWHQQEAEY